MYPHCVTGHLMNHVTGFNYDTYIIYSLIHTVTGLVLAPSRSTMLAQLSLNSFSDIVNSHVDCRKGTKNLDTVIDLTGHVLPPFYVREIHFDGAKLYLVVHLLLYRVTVLADDRGRERNIMRWIFPVPPLCNLAGYNE